MISKLERMRRTRHVRGIEKMKNSDLTLLVRPEGKSSLGRTASRWENNILIYLKQAECQG
jgi:hypothetical protein